jgi:hypothetical protein
MAGGKNAAHRAAASAQLGADRAHKQAKRAEEAAELAEERARKAGVLEDVVAQAEQAAERAERARRGAVAERKATEAAPRVKHGVRALKALDSSAWPTPLREAYNTTLERITTQAELGDPRYGLACEQCSRLVVLIGLFYERLAHLIENGLTIDSQECAAITRQLGAYENGLNRMLGDHNRLSDTGTGGGNGGYGWCQGQKQSRRLTGHGQLLMWDISHLSFLASHSVTGSGSYWSVTR